MESKQKDPVGCSGGSPRDHATDCRLEMVQAFVRNLRPNERLVATVPADMFPAVMVFLAGLARRDGNWPGQAYGAGAWFELTNGRAVLVPWPTRPDGVAEARLLPGVPTPTPVRRGCGRRDCPACNLVADLCDLSAEGVL